MIEKQGERDKEEEENEEKGEELPVQLNSLKESKNNGIKKRIEGIQH